MSEQRGPYHPRLRHPNRPTTDPQPLRELLRQYVEERNWDNLLTPSSANGHGPDSTTSVRHDHG
jgi:hypothetical protein